MKLLHIQFQAYTSTFKMPNINSGTMISCPVPPYSTIVGIISSCLGRELKKDETKIGFKYSYEHKGSDLEKTHRLKYDNGILKQNPDTSVTTREFHIKPILDIYLSNLDLKKYFLNPIWTPSLGRSQDMAWITKIEEIDVEPTESGKIKATLIPFDSLNGKIIPGRFIQATDYYSNYDSDITKSKGYGYVRVGDAPKIYIATPFSNDGIDIEIDNLYIINMEKDVGIKSNKEVIYLHKLGGY
ncbi:CRISPR-associated protein Cas5 [Methanococcus voltae]|uniref:CRISPR-associated protein Cas5t n=1 Tax=Methanococcus voltae TaxID=2188 RepID=A0A8J7US41_METVO|nr:CRISPR-associated protein Cas5 [Methanococcus voltae]MBP2173202.1 CRISPR-associated protein Cas5t [Methanococcus voltae]MBP2201222.1 CRISPR-associated protein Cas5t [Methanococcus voltae]